LGRLLSPPVLPVLVLLTILLVSLALPRLVEVFFCRVVVVVLVWSR